MSKNNVLTRVHLKTPKAAAIAGIAFSALLIIILWLLRRSIPADPLDTGAWLATGSRTIALALNLVPFAGIAFLWFIGVLRGIGLANRKIASLPLYFLAAHCYFWPCCSPQLPGKWFNEVTPNYDYSDTHSLSQQWH